MTKIKIYTAFPQPVIAASGGVYNIQSRPYYDCVCGRTLEAGTSCICAFAERAAEYVALQEKLRDLGEDTDHLNIKLFSRDQLYRFAQRSPDHAILVQVLEDWSIEMDL